MTSLQHPHIYHSPTVGRMRRRTGAVSGAGAHKTATRCYGVTIINLSTIMILILSLSIASAALNSLTPQYSPHNDVPNDGPAPGGPAASSDVIAIKEGANLDLNCSNAEQTEDMIISWTCNNKPAGIKSNRIYVTDSGRLRIQSAKVGDSCNYRCEAADGFGTWSVFIRVIVVDRQLMNKLTAGNQRGLANEPSAGVDKKRTPMKGDPTKFANKEIILNDSQQQQHSASTGELSAGSSQLGGLSSREYPVAEGAGSNFSPGPGLSVQIDPEQMIVQKNHSFNLNCKVNHSSHYKVPQIIWLKEFMGQPPSSLEKALEQNLIHLAGGYYHTLNWPRSISYSRASFCANSALVIKHATFVHSGRYVCLSGYLDRLGVEPPLQVQARDDDQNGLSEPPGIPASVQYVIAVATIKVKEGGSGDGDDEFYYKLRWKENSHGDVLIRIFGTEASIWKLALCLLMLSAAIVITCFYKLRTRSLPSTLNGGGMGRKSRKRPTSAERIDAKKGSNQHVTTDLSLVYPRDEQMKLNDSHHYNLMNRSVVINELERLASSQLSSADEQPRAASSDNTYAATAEHHIKQQQPPDSAASSPNHQFYGAATDGEHLYSEIGELDKTSAVCPDENHHSSSSCYKVPNKASIDY